jgi:hypothetical protein
MVEQHASEKGVRAKYQSEIDHRSYVISGDVLLAGVSIMASFLQNNEAIVLK